MAFQPLKQRNLLRSHIHLLPDQLIMHFPLYLSSHSFSGATRAVSAKKASLRGSHTSGREATPARQQLAAVLPQRPFKRRRVQRTRCQVNSDRGMAGVTITCN